MPLATLKAPDGKTITMQVPEGATQEQIVAFAQANYKPDGTAQPEQPPRGKMSPEERAAFEQDYYRQLNDSLSGPERAAVAFGRGMATIGRGVGIGGTEPQQATQAATDLTDRYPGAMLSEVAGQAAPFLATLPLSGTGLTAGGLTLIPEATTLAGRVALGSINAGAQGNILSRGQGRDATQQAMDTGIGAGVGAGVEVLMPVLGRFGAALFQRVGAKQTKPLVDAAGNASDEFAQVLAANNMTMADAMANVSDMMRKGKTDQLALEVKPNQAILQSAENLGLKNDLIPSHYSGNQSYVEMEQGLKSRAQSQLGAQESVAIRNLSAKADETIQRFGGYTDKSLLDSAIANDFKTSISTLKTQSDDLYKTIDSKVMGSEPVSVENGRAYITDVLDKLGGPDVGVDRLKPVEKDLMSLMDDDPTYAYLDRLRKDVGKALYNKQGVYADTETGILKKVYSALSDDQQLAADALGVGSEFSTAKKLVEARKAVEDKSIEVFGRDVNGSIVKKLSQSANDLTKGDISTFSKLISAVPEGRRQEAVATMLNNVFTHGGRNKDAMSSGFVNAFNQLNRHKEAKRVMLSQLPPEAARVFDDLGNVASGIYNAKKFENTSGTARALLANMDNGHVVEKLFGPAKKIAAAEGLSIMASLPPGVGTSIVLAGEYLKKRTPASEAADKLLSSGAFRDAVITAVENNAKKSASIATNSKPFKEWIALQPANVRQEIATAGFVPWLISNKQENK